MRLAQVVIVERSCSLKTSTEMIATMTLDTKTVLMGGVQLWRVFLARDRYIYTMQEILDRNGLWENRDLVEVPRIFCCCHGRLLRRWSVFLHGHIGTRDPQ